MAVLLSFFLLGIGAFAVDLGQVYAKRSALQSNVDLAVLAAAAELDSAGSCNSEVIAAATDYLVKEGNEVADQIALDLGGSAGDDDGYIRCNDWRVDLWAPRARVDFGLAKAFSDTNDGVDVPAHAAAQIKSPSQAYTLPFYAVSGCDIGHQQISDPPPGHQDTPTDSVPDFDQGNTGPYNTVQDLTIASPDPAQVPSGQVAPVPLTLSGKKLTGTTAEVWFTNANGDHFQAPGAPTVTSGPGQAFQIAIASIPQEVLDAGGIWWVRVFNDGKWSAPSEAQPLTVGDLLFCDGVVSGNFGALRIARSDGNHSTWLTNNIIKGIEPPMRIHASNAVPCSPQDSQHSPTNPTDCVGTEPGFPNPDGTNGFVGSSGNPGRLDADTTENCDRNGGSNRTQTAPALNDDMLSCFIITGDSVQDVIAGKEGILSGDIFSSPRFFMIPVIPQQAANGASGNYPIIDFRPGFITTEASSATRGNPGSVTGHNGLTFHSNKVQQLDVVLFDKAALAGEIPAVGGEEEFSGSGTKVIVLVE